MAKIHEGGCLCGSVRYRVTGDPVVAAACHCKYCQRRTGSAFGISVYFEDTSVEFTSGSLKDYKYRSDESNRWVEVEFCDNCGTSVTWTAEIRPGHRGIAGGTFDDPDWFHIDKHAWTRSAHHWMVFPSNVEKIRTTSLK